MTWGQKRQVTIIGGILLIILGITAAILYPILFKEPTCSDGKQNGRETGVDCGVACGVLCPFEVRDPVVKWARTFPVTSDVWSAAAYIENQNTNAGAKELQYQFKLYDKDRVFITERYGKTFIAPNQRTVVFEGGIKVGTRLPSYATFTIVEKPSWYVTDPRFAGITLSPTEQALQDTDTKPRFTALIENMSDLYTVKNTDVIVVVFDDKDNAIGVSKTYLDTLRPHAKTQVYFTWQAPFVGEAVRQEVFTRFNPFTVGTQQ
jgi:hypothetical protein